MLSQWEKIGQLQLLDMKSVTCGHIFIDNIYLIPKSETDVRTDLKKLFGLHCLRVVIVVSHSVGLLLLQIWNHPDILYNVMKKATMDDNDLDLGDNTETKKRGGRGRGKIASTPPSATPQGGSQLPVPGQMPAPPSVASQPGTGGLPTVVGPAAPMPKPSEPNITYEWVRKECL